MLSKKKYFVILNFLGVKAKFQRFLRDTFYSNTFWKPEKKILTMKVKCISQYRDKNSCWYQEIGMWNSALVFFYQFSLQFICNGIFPLKDIFWYMDLIRTSRDMKGCQPMLLQPNYSSTYLLCLKYILYGDFFFVYFAFMVLQR